MPKVSRSLQLSYMLCGDETAWRAEQSKQFSQGNRFAGRLMISSNKDCLKGTDRRRGRLRGDIRTQAEAALTPQS